MRSASKLLISRIGQRLTQTEGLYACSAQRCMSEKVSDFPGEIGAISGVPGQIYTRKVLIYSPARTATQQGLAKTLDKAGKHSMWRIEFTTEQKWENPLIGWTSTADALEHVGRANLMFGTAEEALSFAKRHGWEYELREPHMRRTTRAKRFLGYGDNFSTKRAGLPDGGLISEGTAEPIKRR